MSEQKYYVKLKEDVNFKNGEDYYGQDMFGYDYMWLDVDHELYPKRYRYPYTKSELAKIMDGALYIEPFLGETGIHPEWINPLIELVPVEEED